MPKSRGPRKAKKPQAAKGKVIKKSGPTLSNCELIKEAAVWGMLVLSPVLAQAENTTAKKKLLPEHDLSIVCLENPYSVDWLEVDVRRFRPTIYSLMKQADDAEGHEVARLRLLVQGQPCFFEFSSTPKGRMGTLQDTSGPLPIHEFEDLELPLVFPEEDQNPIVEELLKECRAATLFESTFPFQPFDDCARKISNVLLLYSTSIVVVGPTLSDENLRVDFVFGTPFLNGKEIEVW